MTARGLGQPRRDRLFGLKQSLIWVALLLVGCTSPTPEAEAIDPSSAPSSTDTPPTATASGTMGFDPLAQAPATVAANPDAPADASVQAVTVLEGLEHPWGMAWLPDGTLLITERPGRVRRVRDGVLDPEPLAGVAPVLAERQGGMLDIALHPQFEDNRWVYLAYAHGTAEANRLRVARARLEDQGFTDWTVIFETNRDKPQGQHFGSRLLWLPDDTLLVAVGDGGNPPLRLDGELIRHQAQNRQTHLGAIVRLNDDGTIPADNPFVNTAETDPALWSYGHRNIQALALDAATGQVWSTEHGSRGGDELNLLRAGENYGWPLVTYSEEYSGGPISDAVSRPGLADPILYWTPAIAPSGLAVYRGDRYPQWQGQLFAGGLVAQAVLRLELDDQGQLVSEARIPIGQRVRDVRQGPDGLIYVLTDAPNGRLVRLEPNP
ncbi:PQQ-dependent sugar dehydrogenase [Leptolyngbya sp. BL0902]|uniref:PQQ-dependent sugar dehydrogenase n=1 Tax=Leptolyngbya sp. BL0902 TaxID=1115757 RepID=UPI0018E6FDCA|nr:PQQ-dependent sugar dehydrogenase [Leptolyngbya sp. BL0902]